MQNHHQTTLALAICAALGCAPAAAATFDVTSNADAGTGSLRQALIDANANTEADTINMSSISGQTINLTSGQLSTTYDDLIINGADVTIDAGGSSRVLYSFSTDLTMNNVTLTNGSVNGSGGGISSISGDLTLNDSTITANSAGDGDGGGVYFGRYYYSDDPDLTISASTISANTATIDGGGLAASTYGNVTINASTISANTAGDDNGGLYAYVYGGANVTVSNSTISGNTASDEVGGLYIYSYQGDVSVSDSTISGNVAGGDYGGLLATAEDAPDVVVTLENTTISNNQAAYFAGASLDTDEQGQTRVTNSTIFGNTATVDFAGLSVFSRYYDTNISPEVIIEYTTVTGNTATGQNAGVALLGNDNSRQNIVASAIFGNTAASDADMFISPASETAEMTFSLLGVNPTTGTLNKDMVSTSLTGQNPLLGPLANNGGLTLTSLPGNGSPLLNVVPSGSSGCGVSITTDQRGEPRPAEGACDIGSVEVQVNALPPPAAVPTLNRLSLLLMAGLLGLGAIFGWRRSERSRTG